MSIEQLEDGGYAVHSVAEAESLDLAFPVKCIPAFAPQDAVDVPSAEDLRAAVRGALEASPTGEACLLPAGAGA